MLPWTLLPNIHVYSCICYCEYHYDDQVNCYILYLLPWLLLYLSGIHIQEVLWSGNDYKYEVIAPGELSVATTDHITKKGILIVTDSPIRGKHQNGILIVTDNYYYYFFNLYCLMLLLLLLFCII